MLATYLAVFTSPFRPVPTVIDIFADVELGIGCIMMLLFTVAYGIFFKFGKTPAGRAIFSFFCAVSAMLLYATFTRLFTTGDYPLRDLFRAIVYAGIPATMIYMLVTLVRNWFKGGSLTDIPQRKPHTGEIDVVKS